MTITSQNVRLHCPHQGAASRGRISVLYLACLQFLMGLCGVVCFCSITTITSQIFLINSLGHSGFHQLTPPIQYPGLFFHRNSLIICGRISSVLPLSPLCLSAFICASADMFHLPSSPNYHLSCSFSDLCTRHQLVSCLKKLKMILDFVLT